MIRNRPYENEDSGLVALVTTPIGNRDDITLRALNFLKEADIIACEDTRNTSLLLSYYGIKNKKYVSLYAQTEAKEAHALVLSVKKNKQKLAYCSDAGMPGISDPGAILVQACHKENVPVTLLPGPTASLSALVLSGIDSADFSFYGFLPTKAGQIKTMLTSLKDRKETLIFYESPKRIIKTLSYMKDVFSGNREAALIRELTKIHEEVIHGTLDELTSSPLEERGECVIIIKGADEEEIKLDDTALKKIIKQYKKDGYSISDLSKEIATKYSLKKSDVYQLALKTK